MDHETNPSADENNPSDDENNPNKRIKLDLCLGIGPQEQDPVDEQVPFMELLRSVSHDPPPNIQPSPPPPHDMAPRVYYNNVIIPRDVSWTNLLPSRPLGAALPPFAWPYEQFLQAPQAAQGRAGDLETPRPPAGPQARRSSSRVGGVERNVGDKEIVPPYPWATKRPAIIQDLEYLLINNINVIHGQVRCRPCETTQTLKYNLMEKFEELERYIKENKEVMRQRAPDVWMRPKLIPCGACQSEMRPVTDDSNKEEINWLFLLLGKMLGCCTLNQLRYFCDKISQHRTGSKDRVLYTTYLGLCNQLKPCDTFSLYRLPKSGRVD